TDGITEAEDAFGEMLGRDRLMAWARMAPTDTHPLLANSCSSTSASSARTISPTMKRLSPFKEVTPYDRRRTKTGAIAGPHRALEGVGTLSERTRLGNRPRRLQRLRHRMGILAP